MVADINDAILKNDLDVVYRLLESGFDLDKPAFNGKTPLMEAAEAENIRILELLLNRGADPNSIGHDGYTALHVAVDISIDATMQCGGKSGDEPLGIIAVLLENGARIDIRNDQDSSPLDIARKYKAEKVINYLRQFEGDL